MLAPKIIALLIVAGLLLSVPSSIFAQQKQAQTGITVTPSILQLDISERPPETTLTYTNTTSATIELSLTAQNFSELEDGWKIRFLEPKDASNYHYALSSWLRFETTTLFLNPGETRTVKVFIDSARLTPGGHYASILAEIKQETPAGYIGLRGQLATLLFVRTAPGTLKEEAHLSRFEKQSTYGSFPTIFQVGFQNTGTVELTPYGSIETFDMFGHQVAKGILNTASLITLPETIRQYIVVTSISKPFILPGFYKAQLKIHYGKTNKENSTTLSFFTLGSLQWPYLALGILVIVIIVTSLIILWKRKYR